MLQTKPLSVNLRPSKKAKQELRQHRRWAWRLNQARNLVSSAVVEIVRSLNKSDPAYRQAIRACRDIDELRTRLDDLACGIEGADRPEFIYYPARAGGAQ